MSKLRWNDLFNYLENKVDFRKEKEQTVWTCYNNLRFTKDFCDMNDLDFEAIKKILNSHGGYCDCEVLFNVVEHLKGKLLDVDVSSSEEGKK